MNLNELTRFLDDLLRVKEIPDESHNGLQVANKGLVTKIGISVDISTDIIESAKNSHIDFLFVHHGMFWNKQAMITGMYYDRICRLMEYNIALYAAHLPLDLHPVYGNNAQIKNVMNWKALGDFGEYHGVTIGKKYSLPHPLSISTLENKIAQKLNCTVNSWPFGKKKIHKVAYVSGGGLSLLNQAVQLDLDAYITGEPKHEYYWQAKDSSINVLFGGHYATETLGVNAVGRLLNKKFGIPAIFIDKTSGY